MPRQCVGSSTHRTDPNYCGSQDGERLLVGPSECITDNARSLIREHKAELLSGRGMEVRRVGDQLKHFPSSCNGALDGFGRNALRTAMAAAGQVETLTVVQDGPSERQVQTPWRLLAAMSM
jgi:hypothetical protein